MYPVDDASESTICCFFVYFSFLRGAARSPQNNIADLGTDNMLYNDSPKSILVLFKIVEEASAVSLITSLPVGIVEKVIVFVLGSGVAMLRFSC